MKKNFITATFALLTYISTFATTVIPFSNLGEMAEAADAVVLATVTQQYENDQQGITYLSYKLQVEETIKGNLQPNDLFELRQFGYTIENYKMVVEGDLVLENGQNYFLYLHRSPDQSWQPMMLAYGVMQEHELDGRNYLVPIFESWEMHVEQRPDGTMVEPLYAYKKQAFLQLMSEVLYQNTTWNSLTAKANMPPNQFYEEEFANRSVPTGCDYLGQSASIAGFRWQNTDIDVYASATGDANFVPPTDVTTDVDNAVDRINAGYGGVNLSYGGLAAGYTPACTGGSAIGNAFITFANLNLAGPQSLFIQFNDPCNQIPDINGCAGVLAVGGSYASGGYQFKGETWASSMYGYVIMNNNILCIGRPQYEETLIHEMTHSTGIGHLNPTNYPGNNMNPSCCSDIGSKDTECMGYIYEFSSLAVDLSQFTGENEGHFNFLEWQTTNEEQHDYFEVESSKDGFYFEAIGKIIGKGTDNRLSNYQFIDQQPFPGKNYYRLKMVGKSGKVEYSDVINLDVEITNSVEIFPNPNSTGTLSVILGEWSSQDVNIQLLDTNGKIVFASILSPNADHYRNEIQLPELPMGIYYLRFHGENEVIQKKLILTK